MKNISLIANSGIQLYTFRLKINLQDKFKIWFIEWYNTTNGNWCLDFVHEVTTEENVLMYNKRDLFEEGFLSDSHIDLDPIELRNTGINPLQIDGEMCNDISGDIYKITINDKNNNLKCFENKWLPIPYFFKRTEKNLKFSPLNWSRVKLVPISSNNSTIEYDVILAFDTRAEYKSNKYNEVPVFPDHYCTEMVFDLCYNEFMLMDYCKANSNWGYINEYIFKLVHPNFTDVSTLRGVNRRMSHLASYIFLIKYLANNKLFPTIKLYKDINVECRNIDMVIDIGNSKTTALLIEDTAKTFTQVKQLSLIDYTDLLTQKEEESHIKSYSEPFDMRLAFRRVDFGAFGIKDSKQFVYPSFVRLGREANNLIHKANNFSLEEETLSTYSSPKRYLWDDKPSKREWEFLVLPNENTDRILNILGISSSLTSDGKIDNLGDKGGRSNYYSRRSLMTFAFLEMVVQAIAQVNSISYRNHTGWVNTPRKIKKIIITCPTAMSKIEREALVKCARESVNLYSRFVNGAPSTIEIIPNIGSRKDGDNLSWYYDEATCAQLVYIYGEIGYKYKGACSEFFNLYGGSKKNNTRPTITIGSLDIGAGTSDLMISEYSYFNDEATTLTTITPDPKFYDSFYFAGDDMLKALIQNVMLLDETNSAFRKSLKSLNVVDYRQKIKDFFGQDHSGQSISDRILRRDFNIQYSVPLMTYFLELASNDSADCVVRYDDVFKTNQPNSNVITRFKEKVGIDITSLEWKYNKEFVNKIIAKEFEPLLKKIAAICFTYSCDIILLSGRPTSLPAIRNIFLKYYPVSPNRLIALNNYYIGDWYPFCNNTGYITNPKTIVAMGGVIGHYASEFSNMDKFTLDLKKLAENLVSTINYIGSSADCNTKEYIITPDSRRGVLQVTKLPHVLNVKQLALSSYPSRGLYSIDFNYVKLAEKFKKREIALGNNPSDGEIQFKTTNEIESLKKRMPFKITIERDIEDKENLTIVSIEDRNNVEVSESCIEIHIQSLGTDEQYWLDSGAFNF